MKLPLHRWSRKMHHLPWCWIRKWNFTPSTRMMLLATRKLLSTWMLFLGLNCSPSWSQGSMSWKRMLNLKCLPLSLLNLYPASISQCWWNWAELLGKWSSKWLRLAPCKVGSWNEQTKSYQFHLTFSKFPFHPPIHLGIHWWWHFVLDKLYMFFHWCNQLQDVFLPQNKYQMMIDFTYKYCSLCSSHLSSN